MKILPLISLLTALTTTGFIYSCSSSSSNNDGSTGVAGSSNSSNGSNGGTSSKSPNGTSGVGSGLNVITNGGAVDALDPDAACGATDVAAELTPVYMVFLYDKSASMGENTVGGTTVDNTDKRWVPVKNGVIDFFTNAHTTNVEASIAFFAAQGDAVTTCTHDYSVPDVPMTSLETPNALITALNDTVPKGGTPTLPAVVGGIKYARKLVTDHPGSEAIVVLVTDGEPAINNIDPTTGAAVPYDDCAPTGITLKNTIPDIATYVDGALRGTPSIKTYVIGIGDTKSLSSLQTIATAGTGNPADFLLIDPTDPTATRQKILDKLTAIQPKTISCNVQLPTTKEGFDASNVNVNFVHGNGKVDELSRSDNCPGAGWRYDNPDTPKYIELCKTSCDAIQSDLDGSLKILLGCPTRVIQ